MIYDPTCTFVTSDHHFGSWRHNPTPFRPAVFSQAEEKVLVEKWNSTVKPTDLVLYVGDFCDCETAAELMSYRSRLNGRIVLIKGNHDRLPDSEYEKAFQGVYERLVLDEFGLALQHCPCLEGVPGLRQIYGHLHDGDGFVDLSTRNSFCSCVMRHDGFPVPLENALKKCG